LSDFTAFQLAVLAHGLAQHPSATLQTGKALTQNKPGGLASSKENRESCATHCCSTHTLPLSYAGPSLCADFGSAEPPDETMLACFNDCISEHSLGTGWRLPAESLRHFVQWQEADGDRQDKKYPNGSNDNTKNAKGLEEPEDLQGVLWGGNLSILVSLLGTPYWPAIEQGILFLEDVNEPPWRVERLLLHLFHAGVLARQRAVLLGQFTGYTAHARYKGHTLQAVVDFLRPQLPCPVLCGLPFGHVPTKVVLPVGAQVSLELRGKETLLLWE
jgi:muramoyltetrapeptide carboxypeptidase